MRVSLKTSTHRLMVAASATAMALLANDPANAKEENFDWTVYPEMSRERALPQIVASLRNTLTDAGSITNFLICYPPLKVKLKDGRPVRWTIMLSLNAKNQYGGYAGNQGMAAVFYSDKPVWTFSIQGPLPGNVVGGCTRVPDAEIQRLLSQ